MEKNTVARFDTRLSKEQKDFFEHAANIGGFRTLTEFILFSAQEKAKKIVEEHNSLFASERDRKIFFDEMMNPSEPNEALKQAAKRYKAFLAK